MGTPFAAVYNRFLGKITDDMYLELTPEDTIKDLRNMLIDAIYWIIKLRHRLNPSLNCNPKILCWVLFGEILVMS